MIYAVDFDGTLANTRFPEILGPREKVIADVKMLKASGHKIILWTSRCGKDLEVAVEWCKNQGITFDAVNEPLPEQIATWGNNPRKIWADVYIDDRAVNVAYNNGWIPCSESYPNTDEYILLSFSNFSVPLVGRWEEDEDGGAFYIGDETESCVSQGIIVNAWQQLPGPYQPEGESL